MSLSGSQTRAQSGQRALVHAVSDDRASRVSVGASVRRADSQDGAAPWLGVGRGTIEATRLVSPWTTQSVARWDDEPLPVRRAVRAARDGRRGRWARRGRFGATVESGEFGSTRGGSR